MFSLINHVPKVSYIDPLSNSPNSDSDDSRGEYVPFDLEEQRSVVASERWRHHVQWCDRMNASQRMTFNNRRISLKILVSEAFHRDVAEAQKRGDVMTPNQLKKMWHDIAQRVMHDMEHQDNSANVLKNLSCMCVFISDTICREYGENVEARVRRMSKMRESIEQLRERGTLFHAGDDSIMGNMSEHQAMDE